MKTEDGAVAQIFKNLIGNDGVKARLGRAIAAKTLPHAFLIDGPDGSGKRTLALTAAAALNCQNQGREGYALPCGVCNFCKRIASGNFPDVRLLGKPEDKASTGVDDIKDFKSDVYLSPTEAPCKVYIINDAETLTPAAQNALLIFLEEPPSGVYIFLLARGVDRILTTIKSRSQYIPMERFSKTELRRHLTEAGIIPDEILRDETRLAELLIASDGRIGLAKALVNPKSQKKISEGREETEALIGAMRQGGSYSSLLSEVRALPQKRAELTAALDRAVLAVRDLLVIKESEGAELLFYTSPQRAQEVALGFTRKRLFAIHDALSTALDAAEKNANIQSLLYALAVRIRGI